METTYKPIDKAFYDKLKTMVEQRAGARIQFYTDIHEFMTLHATFKDMIRKGEEEYLVLTTGEEIRLDRIVRIGNNPAPGYDEDYFKCDVCM